MRYRHKNREAGRLASRRYRLKNRERANANRRRYGVENPKKVKAYALVRQALTFGDLKRSECEICRFLGRPSDRRKTEAHHEDYGRPLDVRWLCHAHHRQLHAQHFMLCERVESSE